MRKRLKEKKRTTVVFTQDFAILKKGDTHTCDSMEAALLVSRGVASYVIAKEKVEEDDQKVNPEPETKSEIKKTKSKK